MNTNFIICLAETVSAAFLFQACTSRMDNSSDMEATDKLHFEIEAPATYTKTSIVGSEKPDAPGRYIYTPMWGGDDRVAVFFSANVASSPKEELINSLPSGEKALFTGDITAPASGEASVFYPYSAWSGGKNGFATLKSVQTPELTSFDSSCDILCAEPKAYSAAGGAVSISSLLFHRLTSVLRIELTGTYSAGNHIRSLKFTAPEGTKLAGNFTVDLESAGIGSISSSSNVVTATYQEGPVIGSGSVFLSLLPCVIAKNSQITVEVRTESYDIVKKITLREDMNIPQGGIAVLKLSVTDTHCTSLLDREGWTTSQVYPGLKWHNFEGEEPVTAKPQKINVVEADLNNSGLLFSFVYSDISQTVSNIAEGRDALAVTNATYGAGQEGVVHIKTNGRVWRTIDGSAEGYTAWKHKAAVWFDGKKSFGFYNYHGANASASKAAYESDAHTNLFSSAPLLIEGGADTSLSSFAEGTNVAQFHPRTVLAVTGSGRLLLIAIDGRLSTAKGMTCVQIQNFLHRYFDIAYAINMDGGGSTAMYVAGNGIVNYPCHGTAEDSEDVSRDHTHERSLPSFFVIAPASRISPITSENDDNEWYQIQ